MSLLEIIIISFGISLDVYSVVVCFGSVVARIDKFRLLRMIIVFCLMQVMAVLAGQGVARIPMLKNQLILMRSLAAIIAVIIFISLGLYMLVKAIKNKPVEERLTNIRLGQVIFAGCITCIDAALAGIAFGLMNTRILATTLSVFIITAIVVVSGLHTGLHLGYEHKTKAYALGSILLIISAVMLILKILNSSIDF